ncbi:MAG: STAS domain-containing protein [Candidatus Riflebacteria bacterium]|nr:STAS domain-containing protein [Candidatus Riflebacteria bacterium]
MDSFKIAESELNGISILTFDGYCAKEGGAALKDKTHEILQKEKCRIILDFTKCSIISSPGIAAILEVVMEVIDDCKGELCIVGLDKSKKHFLQMTGVIPLAKTAATVEEACVLVKTKS